MVVNLEDWPWPERTFMARLSPQSRKSLLTLGTPQPREVANVGTGSSTRTDRS